MRRLLRIAGREYVAYVRTVGFWLSMLVLPVALSAGVFLPQLLRQSAPAARVAVVDLSGQAGLEAEVRRALLQPPGFGDQPTPVVLEPSPDLRAAARTPSAETLQRFFQGDQRLDQLLVVRRQEGALTLDAWSRRAAERGVERDAATAVAGVERRRMLVSSGASPAVVEEALALRAPVRNFTVERSGGAEVSFRDRLPALLGFGMGMLLWSTVLTGAGILLNSTIEEKSNRVLEVLLASASPAEIMGGKVLGVAGIAGTVLGVWLGLGLTLLRLNQPDLFDAAAGVLLGGGLLGYFLVFFVLGYLMYAALFAAVGAFCETTRDAQTLLGPVMLVLTLPILFMSQAIQHPDAPLLRTLSWIPPFSPFLMVGRAAAHPPWWEITGSALLMATATAAVLWLSTKAFSMGALSTARPTFKTLLAALSGRRS